jgi:hypothetical protein
MYINKYVNCICNNKYFYVLISSCSKMYVYILISKMCEYYSIWL